MPPPFPPAGVLLQIQRPAVREDGEAVDRLEAPQRPQLPVHPRRAQRVRPHPPSLTPLGGTWGPRRGPQVEFKHFGFIYFYLLVRICMIQYILYCI